MRNLKVGSKMSKMCQKSSKLTELMPCEKPKGSSGNQNELITSYVLRKWTKAKTASVVDFRFESDFEKLLRTFPGKSAQNTYHFGTFGLFCPETPIFQKTSRIARTVSFDRTILLWGAFDRFLAKLFEQSKIFTKTAFFVYQRWSEAFYTANNFSKPISKFNFYGVPVVCHMCADNYVAHVWLIFEKFGQFPVEWAP